MEDPPLVGSARGQAERWEEQSLRHLRPRGGSHSTEPGPGKETAHPSSVRAGRAFGDFSD